MTDTFTAWLCDNKGAILRPMIGLSSVDIIVGLGIEGQWAIEWPLHSSRQAEDLPWLLAKDRKVTILRKVEGHWPIVVCSGYLRSWALGSRSVSLKGPDLNELPSRRIVAYEAGSSEADKNDLVDDMIKELARENMGASATDTDRDMSSYGLIVATDTSAGPTVKKAFAWRELTRVITDVVGAGKEAGTEVLWQIEPLGLASAVLKTWAGYRADRTYPSGGPALEFSEARGNLLEPVYTEDWSQEANYCYAGGAGKEDERTVVEVEGSEASNPLARREIFTNASAQGTDTTALTDVGNSKLQEAGPIRGFTGTLRESPGQIYGIHWRLGDLVTARHLTRPYTVMVRTVSIAKRPGAPTAVLSKFSIEANP